MITLIYAAYAIGVVSASSSPGTSRDWHGRRRMLLPAIALSIVSALVFLSGATSPG